MTTSLINATSTRVSALGEVACFVRGITFKPEDPVPLETPGCVVCMRTKNVQQDLDESDLIALPAEFVRRQEQYLGEGDLLVSSANSWNLVGKCSWVPRLAYSSTAGGFISILRADPARVLPRYLYYWFSWDRTQALVRSCGRQTTNISNLDFGRCLALELPVPSLMEQQRIAIILDKADAIRRKREKSIRLTEELSRSTFLRMFGDPVTHVSKPLSEVAEVVSGVAKGRKLNERAVVVPYLRVANVQDGYLNLEEIKTIEALPEEVENLALRPGDIVMTEGGDYDKLGRGAIWNHDLSPCIHQNHIFRVRLRQDMVLPEFFAAFLRTREAKGYFLRCAKKTTNLASINMTQLKGLPVPIPPITDQTVFRRAAHTVTEISERRIQAQVEVEHLFSSLMQRAFRGEL